MNAHIERNGSRGDAEARRLKEGKPWSKKRKMPARCECGRPAVVVKHGEGICARCNELEHGYHAEFIRTGLKKRERAELSRGDADTPREEAA